MNLTSLQSAQNNRKKIFKTLCRSAVVFGFWFSLMPTADCARIIQSQFIDKDGQIVRFYKPEPYSAGALILPKKVRGDYYLYSPMECTDSREGFENRLHIDKYQIHFGSIASCKAKSIAKAGKLYRMRVRCNHEEGTSSQSRLKIMLITNGLLVDGDAYKRCATKL